MKETIFQKALRLWGTEIQIKTAVGEMAELIDIIVKTEWRGQNNDISKVIDEVADVDLMIEQLKDIYGAAQVEQIKREKLKSLQDKLYETEKYDYPSTIKNIFKPKVIILNGSPRSGKDTITKILEEECGVDLIVHSTVDKVKDFAFSMGWDGEKTPENRNMLSELKDFYTKHFDGPFNDLVYQIENTNSDYVFCMIREVEEIKKVVDWCEKNGYDVETWFVSRKMEKNEEIKNTGDDGAKQDYEYDIIINNDSDLADLKHFLVNLWSLSQE